MRIIAGEFRGRRLRTQPGRAVRPTSDRLRETLFSVLRNEVPGAVFVDCYAGSGAVGLEALSRGAAEVIFIERDDGAIRTIEQNLAALQPLAGTTGAARVVHAEAKAGLRRLAARGLRASVCFLDPPYAALPAALRTLKWLCASPLLRPDGLIVLEHSRKASAPEEIGEWRRTRLLEQGDSALSFYRRR